uniref:Serpin domain-containing protein n=1 Tax=Stomoxys calcitrans TaxID=35570 RepID=A0A1I8PEI7_STOCA
MRLKAKVPFILCICTLATGMASTTPISNGLQFTNSLQSFSTNIFSEIFAKRSQENIIFSPFSIQTCLTMVRLGATGQTAEEMDQGLAFNGQSVDSIADNFHALLEKYENSNILKIANKVYAQQSFELKKHYNKLLANKFFSSLENIDFSQSGKASEIINKWVESKTESAVKNLINASALPSETRLMLLSAIYFKGNWQKPFNLKYTKEEPFFTDETNSKNVTMMFKAGFAEYGTLDDLQSTAVRLPYANSDLSMVVILPRARNGLSELQDKLKTFKLESMKEKIKTSRRTVHLRLPRFKAEMEIDLKDTLQKMGMKKMFITGDFGNMLKSSGPLAVESVKHKAVIEVNEEGTIAAATTRATKMAISGPINFKADHPFYYIIMNEDSVPLFEGTFVGN